MKPCVVVSAPSSSTGKTTVVCAILQLLCRRFKNVAAVKVGPDFIDPLFHRYIGGVRSGNIDLFFTEDKRAVDVFGRTTADSDFVVVEGAMGYYDGSSFGSDKASTFDVAKTLGAPVVLVLDVKGKALSLCAEINGFAAFRDQDGNRSMIRGVVLNRCSKMLYERLAPVIKSECGVEVLGYLEQNPEFEIPSRHLGLMTPESMTGLKEKLAVLCYFAEKTLDIDGIISLANAANYLESARIERKEPPLVKIAVARDEAFCFYYNENLALLEECGAELCFFSPLKNEPVPAGASALYIGGGYPQLFPTELTESRIAAASIKAFARRGCPVFAECGGFLYLQLLGLLHGSFENKKHLVRFGYIELTCTEDNFLCKRGDKIRGHEFHYFDTTENGEAFEAVKPDGRNWKCIQVSAPVDTMRAACCSGKPLFDKNIVAGFPHLYFPSNPDIARNFVNAAIAFDSYKTVAGGCGGCSKCASCPSAGSCKKD